MNEILATGLISLGSKIYNQLTTPAGAKIQEGQKADFAATLNKTQNTQPTELQQYLDKNNLHTTSDIQTHIQHLTRQLVNSEQVIEGMGVAAQPLNDLSLQVQQGDTFGLQTSDGRTHWLVTGSAENSIAKKIHQLSSMLQQSQAMPGTPTQQLAQTTVNYPQLQSTYKLI